MARETLRGAAPMAGFMALDAEMKCESVLSRHEHALVSVSGGG